MENIGKWHLFQKLLKIGTSCFQSIWWTGYSWMIGNTSTKGDTYGLAVSYRNKVCVHKVGWNWQYFDGEKWQLGKTNIGVFPTNDSLSSWLLQAH